jgi:hypothetical protein
MRVPPITPSTISGVRDELLPDSRADLMDISRYCMSQQGYVRPDRSIWYIDQTIKTQVPDLEGPKDRASILEAGQTNNTKSEYGYIDPELSSSRLNLTHGPCFMDILRHCDSPY